MTTEKISEMTPISNASTTDRYEVSRLVSTGPDVWVTFSESNAQLITLLETSLNAVKLNNTGLQIKSPVGSNYLSVIPLSTFTADRALSFSTGDANREITLQGDIEFANDFATVGNFPLVLNVSASTSVNLPVSGDLLSGTSTNTVSNKTMSGSSNTFSNIGNAALTNSFVTINGTSVSLGASTTITATTTSALTVSTGLALDSGTTFNGSAARTITIDGTVVTLTGSQTLTNKTITGSVATNLVSGAATITLPTVTGTLATLAGTETLTNKTITGSVATNLVSGAATITLPTATGTLATLAGTETLSNKSIVSDSLLLTLASEPTNTVNFDLNGLVNSSIDFTLSFEANAGGNAANFLEGNYDVVGDILPQSIAYKDIGLSTIGTSSLQSSTTYFRSLFSDTTRLFFDLGLMPLSAVANIQMLGTSTVIFEAGTYTVASTDSPQTLTDKNIVPRGTTLTSGTGTLSENYDVLLINKTVASATTVLCPASAPALPAFYVIKDAKGDAATNNITILPTATYTIDGASSFVMNANYQSVKLYWSGTNYYII